MFYERFFFFFSFSMKEPRFSTWTAVLWCQRWRNCERSWTEREGEGEVRKGKKFTQGIPEIVFECSAQLLNVGYVSFVKQFDCCCPI